MAGDPKAPPERRQRPGPPRSNRVAKMTTVGTIRATDTPCKARYQGLIARDSPEKGAVVRTMLATLDAMLRDTRPRNPKDSA